MQRVQKKKTNHIDGKLLLKLLRGNRFPKIWIPYPENGYLRQLLWHRQLSASTDADTVIRQNSGSLFQLSASQYPHDRGIDCNPVQVRSITNFSDYHVNETLTGDGQRKAKLESSHSLNTPTRRLGVFWSGLRLSQV
jgi:hypothetical protein